MIHSLLINVDVEFRTHTISLILLNTMKEWNRQNTAMNTFNTLFALQDNDLFNYFNTLGINISDYSTKLLMTLCCKSINNANFQCLLLLIAKSDKLSFIYYFVLQSLLFV